MGTEGKNQMTVRRRIQMLALAAMLGAASVTVGRPLISGLSGFVSKAHAYVYRQMAPVRVTQVAQTGLWGGCDAALMTTC